MQNVVPFAFAFFFLFVRNPLALSRSTEPAGTGATQQWTRVGVQAGSSAANQAVSAAAQAGMMYRLLMAKGIMDYLHRKEMDKALENLNKKLEAVKREAASGKIGPAQYAAIKAAVDEAYAQNAKMEAPKDKEIVPDLKLNSEKSALDFNEAPSSDNALKNGEEKTALQADDILQSQGAGNINTKDSGEGNSLSQIEGQKRGADFFGQTGGSQPFLINDRMNPGSQNLAIHNSAESGVSSKDKIADSKMQINLEKDPNEFNLERGLSRDFESPEMGWNQSGIEPDEKSRHWDVGGSSGKRGQTKTEANLAGGMGHWLKPIKFQKNPFSTKLNSEEGLHPFLLLLVLGGAFVLGKKLSFAKKMPVIIPEVVREHPRSQSKTLALSAHRSGRRRVRRN